MHNIKRNERDWAGQLISWIKAAIEQHTTVFQDATNDTGVKLESGRTKFPDVLLFTDKVSGIVFNGWELKFPDTAVDDVAMLDNALEKAQKLQSDSFVTWNGAEAIIWKIDISHYSIDTLTRIKEYPRVPTINSRDDLADPQKYAQHEPQLKERCYAILHDLDQLYRIGELRPAINISGNIIAAIQAAATIIIPQFQQAITKAKNSQPAFRREFGKWKIYESSTIKILENSSRRRENVVPEQVLAKFTFYNLIGKILFYATLCENLSGELDPIALDETKVKDSLNQFFNQAKEIDYQAIFKPYFTDTLPYSDITDNALTGLIHTLSDFDFKLLPTEVIGHILENLVPASEKQKFGQYFTPETLANMVAFPVVQTGQDVLFDPTSGTGTFLNAFYKTLNFLGNHDHASLLNQIWGNDVSHFPAILSVINLYKQNVVETDNFPRVMREDFFNVEAGKKIAFPDPVDHKKRITNALPLFDGIASNFPFIQQEDIPNEVLTTFFRGKFEQKQRAFLKDDEFKINERSDYFTYCVYNAIRFLKPNGMLAAITSNAWLGKEYGMQFKKFLLDNFHIKYVVRSNAEHWFKDSQVSTIYFVLERMNMGEPTRFVTLNFKLSDYFEQKDVNVQLGQIEDFYTDIDNCDNPHNDGWSEVAGLEGQYRKDNGSVSVCIVPQDILRQSIEQNENWTSYFFSSRLFAAFEPHITQYHPTITKVIRGERTGCNPMFVIDEGEVAATGICNDFLAPYLKSSSELTRVLFNNSYSCRAFVCDKPFEEIDRGTQAWIAKFKNMPNKNGSMSVSEACAVHKPYWYSIRPKKAHIVTSINPNERWFFTYSETPFTIDQRLIALQVQEGYDVELVTALLNSAITFLTLEMRGTSRNLGALDLNANYLKQIRVLNPDLLTKEGRTRIKAAFQPIKNRDIRPIQQEVVLTDRRNFDSTILNVYGLNVNLLDGIYELLVQSVADRVQMCKR